MHKNYKIKAKNLLAQALNIETELISDTASPKEIENWDSLNQLKLAMILEKEIYLYPTFHMKFHHLQRFDLSFRFLFFS